MSGPTLDSFLKSSRPAPQPVCTSQEIRDRGSIFVANAFQATTPVAARAALNHLKHVVHGQRPATHEIVAWRCMVLKSGRTGLDSIDDFEVQTGTDDDGEKWAASKVAKVMEDEGVIDAVVIVSRWYGGTLLGPARFSHIQTCAREVCRTVMRKDEVVDCISTLSTLDDILAILRDDLAGLSPEGSSTKKREYSASTDDANIAKLKRLITARENAIKSTKVMLSKKQAEVETADSRKDGNS